jgi:SpoVK/Ycf46/Vps4 family AAA+-type ATPase
MEPGIDIDRLVADLAAATDGASGADLEYLCQTAARCCVKEMVASGENDSDTAITERHIRLAVGGQ